MRKYYCTPILYKTVKNIGNVKMSKTCVSNRINKTPKCLKRKSFSTSQFKIPRKHFDRQRKLKEFMASII